MKYLPSFLALALLPSLPVSGASLWTSGHGDIGLALHGGTELEIHFHLGHDEPAIVDGTTINDTEFEAADLTVFVNNAAQTTSNAALATGTGVASGQPLWVLPQGETAASAANLPFVGWGTEELVPGDWSTNLVFALTAVTSPSGSGHFSAFQDDGLGGFNFAFSTADGISAMDAISQAAGSHEHYAMAFSEPGLWEITLTASGTHSTLGVMTSSPTTLSFQVAPEPSRAVLLGLGMVCLILRRRR